MPSSLPPLRIRDLLASAPAPVIGRSSQVQQLVRLLRRQEHHNVLLIGKRGVGKSTILHALASALRQQQFPGMPSLACLALDTTQLSQLVQDQDRLPATLEYLSTAFANLPPAIICLDDAEKVVLKLPTAAAFEQLFSVAFGASRCRLLVVLEEEQWTSFQERFSASLKSFEVLHVPELPVSDYHAVIKQHAGKLATIYNLKISAEAIEEVATIGRKLSSARALPDRALRFFDEVCSSCQLQNISVVTQEEVVGVFEQRQGLPISNRSSKQQRKLQQLPATLSRQVIGQKAATDLVAGVLQRGSLGLKNPHRPIGSFLFLGPSGVGKTELAKVIAKEIYGSSNAFVRLDMSEFNEPHTAARLLGAPPGYVGYEAGGQLTSPIAEKPFSLILLDEIEKAHPSIFDIFLQVLDDGRLTDGRGQTVDFSHTVLVATSNIGIEEIVSSWQAGHDVATADFYGKTLVPLLLHHFRLEFLNRFEGTAVFQPLSIEHLRQVAALELEKMAQRFKHHHVRWNIQPAWLEQLLETYSDPRFGVRPLKRALEQAVETQLSQTLLTPSL